MKIARIITRILAIAGALTFIIFTIVEINETEKGDYDLVGILILLGFALYFVAIYVLTMQTKYPRMSSWFALAMCLLPPAGITLLIIILDKLT